MQNKISLDQIGDTTNLLYQLTGQTTNSTPTEIFVDGISNNRIVLPNNSMSTCRMEAAARRTDATGGRASYIKLAGFYRDANAASTNQQGATVNDLVVESDGSWDCDPSADTTNGSIKITVTGQNGKTIEWRVSVYLKQFAS